MTYFTLAITVEEIKKLYRKLAMQNHPDRGGDTETMKVINTEYQEALKGCHKQQSTDNQGKAHTYYYNEQTEAELMVKINELLSFHMSDVEIALIGVWIWITGETKAHKEQLKTAKCKWHSKRKCWYFQNGSKKRYSKHSGSLGDLASKYGYKNFESDKQTAIGA